MVSAMNEKDEEQIVKKELQTLKETMADSVISKIPMRDYLCRLVYADMLGYDVSFGHVPAIKLVTGNSLVDRRVGYLACCLLLHRGSELTILLTCSIQKDITSSNILDNLMGMTACCQILPVDTIPYILPAVLDNLRHSRELVRQKAVLCLYQFQLLIPDLLEHNQSDLEKMLFDKDPGVMAAAVYIVQNSIERDPTRCKGFGGSLVSILKQISSHKMATMFEFQTVPFPWLQIQILRCLVKLSAVDESLAKSLVPLLKEVLQRTSIKESIAFSILYECIQCILCINPPKHLLDEAAVHIGRFLMSSNPNLKFIGVKLLVALVRVNPEYSVNYQQLIVQSLENPDFNVQRKMYKLLYEIANETNVSVICAKLLTQLQTSGDKFWRSEVITMVISLLERFDVDSQWQIESLFSCLQSGHDIITDNTLNTVMNMVEKKFLLHGADQRSQKLLVQKCVGVLVNNNSLGASLHVSTWVLGELCPLLKNMPDDKVISLFTRHLTNEKLTFSVQSSNVSALQSLVMKGIVNCDTMAAKINECLNKELPIVIKQRLSVILGVCKHGLTLSNHDIIDTTLTFLDDLVTDDLEQGGTPFIPPHLRGVSSETEAAPSLFSDTTKQEETSSSGRPRTESTTSSAKTTEERESGLKLPNVKRVWGKQGRLDTSAKENIGETSCANTNDQTEEEKRQQELASALFGGFQSTKEADNNDVDMKGFFPNSSDTAGWRTLHSSAVRVNMTEQSTGLQDMCISESFKKESEMSKKSSTTDNFISLGNHSNCQTDLLGTEHVSIFGGNETLEDNKESFKHENTLGKDLHNSLEITDVLDDGVTEKSTDNDLDQAISALLDNCGIESEQIHVGRAENSLVQIDSVTFSEQFTSENAGSGYSELGIENETNSAGHTYTEFEDGNLELKTVNSIYQDDTVKEKDQLLLDGGRNNSVYSLDS
ncbi:AP-4 complex subunit epsilon-1-like isoform X2 [Mercenaria mercenaria]|uniref:AP-4 complex subunit epsilon-1-like isoform X2 n=1 Tax=Mercenaria mercenaria TaxID=6596 RepID=UPI00234F1F80|nr:AP-4 complex subunit epsilon-1-like isoform X2 [Mercenaria mercenaria]